jgi:phosphoribosylformimino-5-aminoimidazole carboxamide ribonucleotide (ProFAR) isomerase
VVDLDGAAGTGENRELVRRLIDGSGLAVQVAGGVRAPADVEAWLSAGAAMVVMGTAAVRACAESWPGRVVAALDARAGLLSVTGWTADEERPIEDVLSAWDGASLAGVIVTSIDRDGTLAGPDLELLSRVLAATPHPVAYAGGIGSLHDLAALAQAGAAAAILGKALFEGRFTLAEALATW